jgi:predicted dehydrogenase
MDRQLQTALIGCGGISGAHLPNILNTPEMHLLATMDVDEDAARRRAEQAEAEYFTTDLDRVLGDDRIDAVFICSTHDTHADLVVKACEAGKHIFAEKPLAMTLEEARRVQRAVHESGVRLMSGWWFKHSPVTRRLREVVTRPYFILFTCRLSSPQHSDPDDDLGPYGRNGILDAAGYNLHWIWHVMRSQPVEVYAMGFDGRPTNTSTISIRFENGGTGQSIYSTLGTGGILPKHYAEVQAGSVSAATLRFGNLVFEGTDEPGIDENRYHNGFDEEMKMFARLCIEGGPSPMDAWEASVPTLIFEKAVESMRTGQPVPVNIEDEFYLPDGRLPASIERFGDV